MDWKLIAAVLLLPFALLKKVFPHLLTKGGLIIIGVVIVIVILVNQGHKTPAVPTYTKNVPSVKDAPVVIQTASRRYYVKSYSDDGKVLTLTEYYWFNDDEWEKSKNGLVLDRSKYGTILISKRATE